MTLTLTTKRARESREVAEKELRYNVDLVADLVADWKVTRRSSTLRKILEIFRPAIIRARKKYQQHYDQFDELNQIAQISIVKALDDFDPSRGIRFASVVNTYIFNAMYRYIRDNNGLIRLPAYVWTQRDHEAPKLVSLDRTPDDSDNRSTLDIMIEEDFDFPLEQDMARERLYRAIEQLTPLERAAIKASYLDPTSPSVIAEAFGVSRETVRKYRRKAEQRLRELLAS